jgi:integrase/recombinase XerD
MADLTRVRVSGPLAPFALGFAEELTRLGFTTSSARQQVGLVAHLSRWLAAHLFGYLRALGVVAPVCVPAPVGPVDELLALFRVHLLLERGLVEEVVAGYARVVRPFVESVVGPGGIGVKQLDGPFVVGFVAERVPRLSQKVASLTVTALRSLLRYLFLEGRIERPLADAVPSVASRRLATLPKRLEPDQVRALLPVCDPGSVVGRRDRAILTLLARLGLRSCEVAGLSLDDVYWGAGEIVVRGKGALSGCRCPPMSAR